MFYTAERAAKLVARYIGYQWPQNRDEIFQVLTLVNDRIWNEGSWWKMTDEFFVRTRSGPDGERYIVCPPGYDILKAVNLNGRPKLQRDRWFQFHKNASGTIDRSCNWCDDVVDLGEHPTINDIFNCPTKRPTKILVGATLTGKETDTSNPGIITIQGEWDREGPVITYEKEKFPDNRIEFLNEKENYNPVFGAKIALNDKIRFVENIWWRRISSITKDVTVNPVEVYAFHVEGTQQLISVLQPHETEAKHRRYLVPKECSSDCPDSVHAMFKVSEPEEIVFDTQPIYTRSREALISLAIGVSEMFEKKQPANSIPFTLNGIKTLDSHNREKQSSEVLPIQVTGPYIEDVPETIRYLDI